MATMPATNNNIPTPIENLPTERLTPPASNVLLEKYVMAATKAAPIIPHIIFTYFPATDSFSSITIIGIANITNPRKSELI